MTQACDHRRIQRTLFRMQADPGFARAILDGEREALARIRGEDPGFVEALFAALEASGIDSRVDAYESLLERAFAPGGRRWGPGETAGSWLRFAGTPSERSRWEALAGDDPPSVPASDA